MVYVWWYDYGMLVFVAETECIENMLYGLGVVVSLWFVGGMLVFVELVGYSIVGLSWLEVSVCIWVVRGSRLEWKLC